MKVGLASSKKQAKRPMWLEYSKGEGEMRSLMGMNGQRLPGHWIHSGCSSEGVSISYCLERTHHRLSVAYYKHLFWSCTYRSAELAKLSLGSTGQHKWQAVFMSAPSVSHPLWTTGLARACSLNNSRVQRTSENRHSRSKLRSDILSFLHTSPHFRLLTQSKYMAKPKWRSGAI